MWERHDMLQRDWSVAYVPLPLHQRSSTQVRAYTCCLYEHIIIFIPREEKIITHDVSSVYRKTPASLQVASKVRRIT